MPRTFTAPFLSVQPKLHCSTSREYDKWSSLYLYVIFAFKYFISNSRNISIISQKMSKIEKKTPFKSATTYFIYINIIYIKPINYLPNYYSINNSEVHTLWFNGLSLW